MNTPHPMSIPHTYSSYEHGLLIPVSGIELHGVDGAYHVFIHEDSRGPSDSYEGYSLVAFTGTGRRAWHEGIRKDRTCMREPYKTAIDAILGAP